MKDLGFMVSDKNINTDFLNKPIETCGLFRNDLNTVDRGLQGGAIYLKSRL